MRVLNKKYWPFQYKVVPEKDAGRQVAELERFCYEHFKSGNWRNYGLHFAFKRQSDATFFVLKLK